MAGNPVRHERDAIFGPFNRPSKVTPLHSFERREA
jgi:hypothetical protein